MVLFWQKENALVGSFVFLSEVNSNSLSLSVLCLSIFPLCSLFLREICVFDFFSSFDEKTHHKENFQTNS